MRSLQARLTTLTTLILVLCLAQSLTMGDREQEVVAEGGETAGEVVKREGGRRMSRDPRYRMGYMFGKRSSVGDHSPASFLVKTLTGKVVSVDHMAAALQHDQRLAHHVARHLDRNGDGFVTVGELL